MRVIMVKVTDDYKNVYGKFLIKSLASRGVKCHSFCRDNNFKTSTLYDIMNSRTKHVQPKTLSRLARALGYTGLKEFKTAYEIFDKYGMIKIPERYKDFSPEEVSFYCIFVLVLALIFYIIMT